MRADALALQPPFEAPTGSSPGPLCRCGGESGARRQIEHALAVGVQLGLALRALAESPARPDRASDSQAPKAYATPEHPALRRRSGVWTLSFAGRTAHMPDCKGLRYLARLLEAPHQAVHVTELAAPESGSDRPAESAAELAEAGLSETRSELRDEILDAPARAAYRARLAELREVLAGLDGVLDPDHEQELLREKVFLERELGAALGLGGRARRTTGSGERARKAVCNRIRHALRRMREVHPELAAHLARAVQTGTECVYRPSCLPERHIEGSPRAA